jgi:hypothetical protein
MPGRYGDDFAAVYAIEGSKRALFIFAPFNN